MRELVNGDAVKKYNSNTYNIIMILWPTNDDKAYKTLKEFIGNKLIYCGGRYGFNADGRFL